MKRSTIKEAFGGEVPFTKFISKDQDTSNRLLSCIDLSFEDGYTVTPEEHTADDKRVDLVVRDSSGEINLVIESQDATGWLDSIHASKIMYYMYDRKCEDSILLTEDANEHIKSFVKFINENTPWNIHLIATVVYELGNNKNFVDFVPLIRPSSLADKKVRRVGASAENVHRGDLERIFEENPGVFTNQAKYYNSVTDVGGSGLAVVYGMNNSYYRVSIWHHGRKNNDKAFNDSFTAVAQSLGHESKSRKDSVYISITDEAESIRVFKEVVDAIKNKNIVY
jgi:hypothetical protein